MPARAAQDRDRIDRAIHHASWLGAFAMFAYGAALSFDVLHSIAQAAGLSPVLAWLWPLGFETFMAVAAVAILAEQRSRPGQATLVPVGTDRPGRGQLDRAELRPPLHPPGPAPRLLVACVYGVPPITAPLPGTIKMLKRQMYGRAGLPLLRKRVLLTAAGGSRAGKRPR